MSAEQPTALRPKRLFNFPPCERHFIVHYDEQGEPISLLVDDKPYSVRPRRRGTRISDGHTVLVVVETIPNPAL